MAMQTARWEYGNCQVGCGGRMEWEEGVMPWGVLRRVGHCLRETPSRCGYSTSVAVEGPPTPTLAPDRAHPFVPQALNPRYCAYHYPGNGTTIPFLYCDRAAEDHAPDRARLAELMAFHVPNDPALVPALIPYCNGCFLDWPCDAAVALAALRAAEAGRAATRDALRKYAIRVAAGPSACYECGGGWLTGQPEYHADGCLAALGAGAAAGEG